VIQVKKAANDWRIERLKKIIDEGTATDEDKARFALLLEAINPESAKDETSIVMSRENQSNVAVLPSKADDMIDPDYNEIPVEAFGLAFLRGCGWKETAGIGKSNRKAVPLRISEPRPKGLGLGASISLPPGKEKKSSEKAQQNGSTSVKKEQDSEEVKPLGKRSFVKCLGGLNKDAIGEVISMDEDIASVYVELSWPPKSCGKTVRMSQRVVQVISSSEYREKLKESRATSDPEVQFNDRIKGREDRKSRDKGERERKRRRSRDRDSRRGGSERIRAPS
jgi:G patch domain/KOW motif-containing protein